MCTGDHGYIRKFNATRNTENTYTHTHKELGGRTSEKRGKKGQKEQGKSGLSGGWKHAKER
jgi:hypothetical protein